MANAVEIINEDHVGAAIRTCGDAAILETTLGFTKQELT